MAAEGGKLGGAPVGASIGGPPQLSGTEAGAGEGAGEAPGTSEAQGHPVDAELSLAFVLRLNDFSTPNCDVRDSH